LTTPFQYVNYAIDVHPDARVFAYSAISTALAAVLCGIAPIRIAGRVDVVEALKQSAPHGRSRASMRTLNATVVVQFAVSTSLLAGAGMLVRTYIGAQSAHVGFDAAGVIASKLDVDQIGLDRPSGIRFYQNVMDRLSALPGVADVSLTRELPFGPPARTATVMADTGLGAASAEPVVAAPMLISPRYFRTLGVTIRQGRGFDDEEPARPPVALINETMARRLWPQGSPLGRAFRIDRQESGSIEVIGTVTGGDERPHGREPQPAFYRPFPQEYSAQMTALIRTHGDPAPLFEEVRQTIRAVNSDLSIVDLRTLDELRDGIVRQRRVPATIVSVVGFLGLLLSAVGLYGVVAYGVRERTRELGIRLALGARPADLRRLVLRQGFTIVGIGLAAGTVGTIGTAQVVRRALFGISPPDPATFAVVCAVLLAAAFAALYLPARWASRVEPAQTLRGE
jgi:predicted permease